MGEPSSQKVFWPAESFRVLKGRNVTTDNIGGETKIFFSKKRKEISADILTSAGRVRSAASSIRRLPTFCIYLRFCDLQ